jgi:hypothetical protein
MPLLTFESEISQHHMVMPSDYTVLSFSKSSKINAAKNIIIHLNHIVESINITSSYFIIQDIKYVVLSFFCRRLRWEKSELGQVIAMYFYTLLLVPTPYSPITTLA